MGERDDGPRKRKAKANKATNAPSKQAAPTQATTTTTTTKGLQAGQEVKAGEKVGALTRFGSYMFEPEDAAFLAGFRIMWGFIMAYEAYTFTLGDWGKMYYSFYNSSFHFKYWGMEWTAPPSDPETMKIVMVAMLLAGIGIMLGLCYRLSAVVYFVLFTYMFSLEQGVYLNHFYLVCVMSFLIIFFPCDSVYSLDQYIWPEVHSDTCARLYIWTIRTLLVVVYFYAGVAKVNEDWLRAEPLIQWLAKPFDNLPWWAADFLQRESTAYAMSYGGMVYDLIVGPLLVYPPTLWLGFALTMFFHITNKLVMNIGIFPWFMIASTTFFFDPSWPRYVIAVCRGLRPSKASIPVRFQKGYSYMSHRVKKISFAQWCLIIGFVVFLVVQTLIPLRLHLYPGDVKWTEYGHKFSWRMKLRTKKCFCQMFAYQPNNVEMPAFEIPMEKFSPPKFLRKMAGRADMIVQAANFFANTFAVKDLPAEIYVYDYCRLNGRPLQQLIDPYHDLGQESPWDIPFEFVKDLQPLTEEEKKWFPWNFEWNFNWLRGHDPNRFKNGEGYAMYMRNEQENNMQKFNNTVDFFEKLAEQGRITEEYRKWMMDEVYAEQQNYERATPKGFPKKDKKRAKQKAPPKPEIA